MTDETEPVAVPNRTDYVFPTGWSLMSPEERSAWFTAERARRQAARQSRGGRRAE